MAALAVVFYHATLCLDFPHAGFIENLCGRTPVLFFFILSGFVLGKSLQRETKINARSYGAFVIRRFFRLYPALLAALVFSAVAAKFTALPAEISQPTEWCVEITRAMVSVDSMRDYLREALLQTRHLDVVVWSLYVEFICSFFLPLAHKVTEWRPGWQIYILLFLFVLAQALIWWRPEANNLDDLPLQFMVMFYLGYMISRIRNFPEIVRAISPPHYVAVLWAIAFIIVLRNSFGDSIATIFLGGFFVLLVPNVFLGVREALAFPFSRVLGKCSYSLYLLHLPVLFLVRTFLQSKFPGVFSHGVIPAGLISFAVTSAVVIPLSILSEKWIEKPFDRVGHRISGLIHQRAAR